MRLLRIEAGGNFSLIEYEGKNIPCYAILSHTWGKNEEEVTFRDLTDGTGTTKAGYRKIRFCGEQAAQDGLQYFWVDTCCIDKSSSAELSEAINSMFRWYRDAARCYVYLSDVSAGASSSRDQSFLNSRWFSRGWTLQELLAPKFVEFFSSEGHLLGSKDSLFQEIATTTRIPVEALCGKALSKFSVNERMSWAEKRETKREEDAAYCLLGLFDIQIPLLYGEGRQNALRRLRNEIKSSGELGRILKWLAPPEFAMVYHEYISEREGDTGQWIFSHPFFRSWLDERDSPKTLGRLRWIHGHPGGGKTTLAASVIQYLSSGQHDTLSAPEVFYFFFRHDNPSHNTPVSAYRSILSQFLHRHSDTQAIVEKFCTVIEHGRKSIGQTVSSEPELVDLLKTSLETLDSAYIILDGVDECSNISSLIKVVEQLGKSPKIRILILSRPNIHGLVQLIQEEDRLPFGQHEVDDDIRIYLRRSLESMAREHRLRPNANLNQYIQHLVIGADKMFLWAKLMIKFLQSPALTPSMIEQQIWNITLPEGLEVMYDRIFNIMGQSPAHQQELATRILSWVLYSRRELSIKDLQTVVIPISDDVNDIHEVWYNFAEVVSVVTCGLVTYQRTNGSSSFHLIHISASDYIMGWKPTNPQVSSIDLLRPAKVTANLELATTSLQLLLRAGRQRQPSNNSDPRILQQPMISYAAEFWISHLDLSITPSPSSLWDIERHCNRFKELQNVLSRFLTSPNAIATFIEAFHIRQRLNVGPFYGNQVSELHTALERGIQTVLTWTEWAQTMTFLDSLCQDFQSTLTTLREFCSEMTTFAKQWGQKLIENPSLIWRDALVFHSSRFLPEGSFTRMTSFVPRAAELAGVSSRPLCHISATSKDTNVLGVLSIWPSEQYEKFWRNLDPYAAYHQVERFCTGWTAHYELWSTVNPKMLVFAVTVPCEASEVALQMRQAFRHEHDASWKTSFPTAISPDGLTISILRTLYQFSSSSLSSKPTWKTMVLPLHSMDGFRQKWDHNLNVFDPRSSHIRDLPTCLRLLFRDWYTYTLTFSPDCRYLLFSDHQEPFCRNLVLFGDLNNSRTGPSIVSSITLNTSKAELRLIMFHPTYSLIAFVCAGSVWTWNYRTAASRPLSRIHSKTPYMTSETPSNSEVVSMCFSLCGRYISVTLERGLIVVQLDMQDLVTDPEHSESFQCTQVHGLESVDRGQRPQPMSLEAVLCPTTSQDSVILSSSIHNSQLEQGCILDITPKGSISAKTSHLIGSTLVEEQAHLLELPSNAGSTKAVVKHHTAAHTDQDKLSIILNKTTNIGYDMNDQRTDVFPALVQIDYASITNTVSSQPLLELKVVDTKPGLKRPNDCEDTIEHVNKVRRVEDCFRASSQSTLFERHSHAILPRLGLDIELELDSEQRQQS